MKSQPETRILFAHQRLKFIEIERNAKVPANMPLFDQFSSIGVRHRDRETDAGCHGYFEFCPRDGNVSLLACNALVLWKTFIAAIESHRNLTFVCGISHKRASTEFCL